MFAPRCAACDQIITPAEVSSPSVVTGFLSCRHRDSNTCPFTFQGSKETVRVVSMNKDYHVDCYVCEVTLNQLSSYLFSTDRFTEISTTMSTFQKQNKMIEIEYYWMTCNLCHQFLPISLTG